MIRRGAEMRRRALIVTTLVILTASGLWAGPNIEKLATQCARGQQQACTKLAQIAKTDQNRFVRQQAVAMLTDQAVLAEIAKTDEDSDVRLRAVRKLKVTDQAVLAQIAKTDQNMFVRQEAVGILTDQAALAEIAKTDEDSGVRLRAVRKLTDQALLAHIAKTDQNRDVVGVAIEKLTDAEALAEVALSLPEDEGILGLGPAVESAVRKVDNPTLLEKVARNARNTRARLVAAGKLPSGCVATITPQHAMILSLDGISVRLVDDTALLRGKHQIEANWNPGPFEPPFTDSDGKRRTDLEELFPGGLVVVTDSPRQTIELEAEQGCTYSLKGTSPRDPLVLVKVRCIPR